MTLKANYSGCRLEAGCDEAGRGCIAGPVVAAAVILQPGHIHPELNDSKQLKAVDRIRLGSWIEKNAIATGIGLCTSIEIDQINILQASILAMHRALDNLSLLPEFVLVDGNRFKSYHELEHACIIKGDAKFASIAAASILAKYYRDRIMMKLHDSYPQYGWSQNKGYPTAGHRSVYMREGPTPYHRRSFHLKEQQLSLL